MSGCHNPYASYYGVMTEEIPVRTISEDLARENKKNMIEELKESEERIKRHVTECKREIIRLLQSMQKELEKKYGEIKGEKDGSKDNCATCDDGSIKTC